MESTEPLSQVAQALGTPWWLFAVVSQALVIVAPIAGLWGLRRWQSGPPGDGTLARWRPLPQRLVLIGLPAAAGLFIFACALYCLAWWPKPPGPRILEPDASILCWLYCGVFMTWPWAVAAMANGLALVAAGGLLGRPDTRRSGGWLAVVAGLIAFPLGLLGVYAGAQALLEMPE
ncbi:MAG: hypothetical protein ACE5HA_02650 [Anaerolineae bacterium]